MRTLLLAVLLFTLSLLQAQKPRLLVLTDIGGDPDDQQSMIRLLVHANEFEIEGLIASASGTPGELGKAVTRADLIEELVRAYGKVEPRLREHDPGFPPADDLLAVIKSGNPQRGWENVGEGHDTSGSEWIIRAVNKMDDRPLNICIWGGQTDLAQALWRVRHTHSDEAYRSFVSKLRIYDIADQDGIFERMWAAFPGLFYVLNKALEGADKREAVFRGMYLGGPEELTSLDWLKTNVIENHGPLGALYPQKTWTAPNPYGALKEGDTPSWFFFLRNGLNEEARPAYGGWGGRFAKTKEGYYRDAIDQVGEVTSARASVWRWRQDFQNELAARMDWCVKSFAEANHHPRWKKSGGVGTEVINVTAGKQAKIKAPKLSDPDGDALRYEWFFYPEAGQDLETMPPLKTKGRRASLAVPVEAAGKELHLILRVRDTGAPALSVYRRVVVRVR